MCKLTDKVPRSGQVGNRRATLCASLQINRENRLGGLNSRRKWTKIEITHTASDTAETTALPSLCLYPRTCVRTCARACMYVCVRARACMCVCVFVCVCVCVCASACMCVCVRERVYVSARASVCECVIHAYSP